MNLTPDILNQRARELATRSFSASMQATRSAFLKKLTSEGWPSTTDEMFRYANLGKLYAKPWSLRDHGAQTLDVIPYLPAGTEEHPRLVFVDGIWDEKQSRIADTQSLRLSPLDASVEASPNPPQGYQNAFLDLNHALFSGGAFIHKKNDGKPATVVLLFLSTKASDASLISLKNIVRVDSGADLRLLEVHAHANPSAYWSNIFTHADAGTNAHLRHTRIQCESTQSFHLGGLILDQARDSRIASLSANFGGQVSRVDVASTLSGPGASCDLQGLYYSKGTQSMDQYTLIDHAKEHCTSNELFKGVLDDQSAAAFTGKVLVRKDAQKTDSRQLNRNLVLSKGALAESLPQLEIFANDVKCSHGSTIGELDDNEIFYLRSRGMTQEQARRELIQAYALEILEFEPDAAIKDFLQARIFERLA